MLLVGVIILIVLLSMGLSYMSLQNDMKKGKHLEEVKKDLKKERVIYYAPAHKERHKK